VSNTLASEMLIPGFRSDVLSLLDAMGHTYVEFLVEHEGIREEADYEATIANSSAAKSTTTDQQQLR